MRLHTVTLAENTATRFGTLAEHGFSIYVEVDGLCLLLDTGQTSTAVHTGGLRDVLAETGPVVVHGHSDL